MQPLTAGQLLGGRFRLIRPIGRGGLGEVWLAERDPGKVTVALKFATRPNAASLETIGRLRAEFEQTRQLVHPNIVRVLEFVSDTPDPFLVMDYVDGTNLGTLRGAGFRVVLRELLPVAEALEYAHRQGVVHRDLKPSNVLRDRDGSCRVADFGASGGSLPGMSPQQLAGELPSVSDDVYGFGSLLFDLLTGQPLFHPDVSPERVRSETPVVPTADLNGELMPAALTHLLGSLLRKLPGERPPTMAAVRVAIEDLLTEHPSPYPEPTNENVIRLVDRGRAPLPEGQARIKAMPVPGALLPVKSLRSYFESPIYVGLAALGVVAAVVVFYLPSVVRERGPIVSVPSQSASNAAVQPAKEQGSPMTLDRDAKEVIENALGELLRNDDELRKINAEKWAGADLTELRRLTQAGDEAYRIRDGTAALDNYRKAVTLGHSLVTRAPKVLAEALSAGQAAFKSGDQAKAVSQFETALAVDPGNAEARRGLDRAGKLDQLLALTRQGNSAEAAGQLSDALRLYRQADAVDGEWSAATAGIARLEQAVARDAFQTQMARGLSAMAGRDFPAARSAFEAALRARPGDEQARAALAQVDANETEAHLAALQNEASSFENQELWREAAQRYDAALALDQNSQAAQEGRQRSKERADMDQRLKHELGNADRFNDDAVLHEAQRLLDSARGVPNPGPSLTRQIAELGQLLQTAVTPVHVTIESDSLTDVTLYKVGRLGAFASKTLELRPGAYTAVGSRPGYRDVRRNFRVGSEGGSTPIVIRCEEPI